MHPGTMLTDAIRAPDADGVALRQLAERINGKGGEFERPSAGTPSLETLAARGSLPSRPDPEIAQGGNGTSKSSLVLNPRFVEALMGWPIGWTDCEHSATESFRRWQHSHGGCSFEHTEIIEASEWPTPLATDSDRGAGSTYARGNETLGLAARQFVEASDDEEQGQEMALVTLAYQEPVERRAPEEVLGLEWSSPSARGSTYWRRVQQCAREHMLANEVRLAPKRRSDPLDVGLVWHYALEAYYRGIQLHQQGQSLDVAPDVAAFKVLQPFAGEPGWGKFHDQLSKMLDSYLDTYHGKDRWEILAVEETLEIGIDVGYGFEYSSRFDLWVVDHSLRQRATRHVEHKSASSLDGNTISGYLLDQQILGQIWLAEKCLDHEAYADAPYLGAYVNITTKPRAESGKTSIPQHVRIPVSPSEQQLLEWENAMRYWYAQREFAGQHGNPPNYGLCVRRYGRCAFFNLCQARPALDGLVELRATKADLPEGYRWGNRWDDEELGG